MTSPVSSADQAGGGFPHFLDGDVLVVLAHDQTYHLHARTLRLHSTFFRRLLSEDRAAKLSSKTRKEGVKITYRVELQLPHDDQAGTGSLVLRVSHVHLTGLGSWLNSIFYSFSMIADAPVV